MPSKDPLTRPDGLHRIELEDGRKVIIKCRRNAPTGFFEMEAYGLELLRAVDQLPVPAVYGVGPDRLVIEDLGHGRPRDQDWCNAGRRLAGQHQVVAERFGLDRSGWCGDGEQDNTRTSDGWLFFIERRLHPQAERAHANGYLVASDLHALERLCTQLPDRIPRQPASLVHGDLWTANLHPTASGALSLIDAGAVHYGWPETDLAMLTLFGEPPRVFFDAYQEAAGVDAQWRARAPIYNLYHLLNHLNVFGTHYLGAVRRVLQSI